MGKDSNPKIPELLAQLSSLGDMGFHASSHIRIASSMQSWNTFSPEWTRHYIENVYMLRDPSVFWGFSNLGVTRWSENPIPDPSGIFKSAADFGMRFGATASYGDVKSRSILSISRSDREFTDQELQEALMILRQIHHLSEVRSLITDPEREALRLSAEGLKNKEAAMRIGITESAFAQRLISARKRLNARNTLEATQKAKSMGLI